MNNNVMDYIGLANVLEKKEFIIDGKKQTYYELIDYAIGFWHTFSSGEKFVVLTGKIAGKTIDGDSVYKTSDFKTFSELCKECGNCYDFDKFVDEYNYGIGIYFTYDSSEKFFHFVKNKELLQKIQSAGRDYDDTILNSDTDISQMYSEIKKTIVSQDEQIMKILTSLFKNQKVIGLELEYDTIAKLKENIIVYGSTGTGKTEILKRIASIYKVPIVIEDATSLSETGYVGRNITDMLEDLYLAAGKDIEKAEKGILVIDEFDKLAETSNNSKDHVSRIGVQRSLLKLLDGSTFYFGDKKFDTSRLSVIALGAFTGIVKDDDYSNVSPKDFENYGMMRELMGRFSKLVAMNPLSKEDIKKILKESNFSPLNTYKLLFDSMDIEFSYDESFIDYIAEKAVALNSGARSLKTIFDDTISSAMFRIFAGEYSSINLTMPTKDKKPYTLTKKR